MTNEAITAGMPTVKKNGMIGTNPPIAVETLAEIVDRHGFGKCLLRQSELLVHERAQKLLGLLLEPLGHGARFFGREALSAGRTARARAVPRAGPLRFPRARATLPTRRLRAAISTRGRRRRPSTARWPACRPVPRPARPRCRRCSRPCRRRCRRRRRGRRSRRKSRRRSSRVPRTCHRSRRRIVSSADRGVGIAPPASCAGRPRGRALRASPPRRSGGPSDRSTATATGRIRLRPAFSSCSRRCSTTPGRRCAGTRTARARLPARSGALTGRERDPLRPPRGVLVFLLGHAQQEIAPFGIALAFGEQLVGVRGFDLAAPHRLDGGQIGCLGHRAHPTSRSKTTMVAMPAAMRTTWRSALASTWPRCRSGMRSDIAM